MDPSNAEGQEDQQHLLKSNAERIEHAYRVASQTGRPDSVVMVLDVRDPKARGIAEALTSRAEVERVIESRQRDGLVPTEVLATTRESALNVLTAITPSVGELLAKSSPAGSFLVEVIAQGGNLVVKRPIPN